MTHPDRAALIFPDTGERLSYAELDEAANQAAQLFREAGLRRGDTVAVLSDNCVDYYVAWWGAQRSGLYFNGMPTSATLDETVHVVNDCAAGVLLLSATLDVAAELAGDAAQAMPGLRRTFSLHDHIRGTEEWRVALAQAPKDLISDPSAGTFQPYSSGSTGRPKGIRQPLPDFAFDARDPTLGFWGDRFGDRQGDAYIAPGPLSHTLTLVFASLAQRLGATVIQMSRFKPEAFLSLVDQYRVSFAQMTPAMLTLLAKTPQEQRQRFDVSSLTSVVHSAAPCAPGIKHAMIDWWGPIIDEFYTGSEALGCTLITSTEWLQRPGSVGRPVWGAIHICDPAGEEVPPGQSGAIYFEGVSQARVMNDPVRDGQFRHPQHPTWGTFGEIGYVDADGYLYVQDRAAFVIKRGGRDIYAQEIENLLIDHPKVADAAVIGVRSQLRGENIKAVVQPLRDQRSDAALREVLLAHCRERLAPEKVPDIIEFTEALPRSESGKLYKLRL